MGSLLPPDLGPFFAVDAWSDGAGNDGAGNDGAGNEGAGWRSLRDLGDADTLRERIAPGRAYLESGSGEAVEERVAASVVSLGLFARLVGPLLAMAAVDGVVADLTSGDVWWRPVVGGPWPIAWSPAASVDADPDVVATVIARLTGPLVDAFAETFALSEQVLWGNVASACGGAVTMIGAADLAAGARGRELVGALLERAPLVATADLVPVGGARPGVLVRRSCCLYYRIPGGGTCGDCVLA